MSCSSCISCCKKKPSDNQAENGENTEIISRGPPKESRWIKFWRIFRSILANIFSHIGLVGLVIGYCLLGAFMFEFLEAGQEKVLREAMTEERQGFVLRLWNLTMQMNVLYPSNWTNDAELVMLDYQEALFFAQRQHGYDGQSTEGGYQKWSFGGALLYSVTVITTIGYGHITPRTTAGRMITIFYALFGIPLMLLCLTNIGSTLADTLTFAYTRYSRIDCCGEDVIAARRRKRRAKRAQALQRRTQPPPPRLETAQSVTRDEVTLEPQVSEAPEASPDPPSNTPIASVLVEARMSRYGSVSSLVYKPSSSRKPSEARVPVTLVVAIVVGYICVGATIFSYWEGWGFLDGET